jgi:GT2 family glycosyltransferase
MLMPWSLWDDVGYFTEPGGPGGSEDYDYCMRAKAKGYGFAVTEPQCVIHCGLTSSSGNRIVGYSEMCTHNEQLIRQYGLEGNVIWR